MKHLTHFCNGMKLLESTYCPTSLCNLTLEPLILSFGLWKKLHDVQLRLSVYIYIYIYIYIYGWIHLMACRNELLKKLSYYFRMNEPYDIFNWAHVIKKVWLHLLLFGQLFEIIETKSVLMHFYIIWMFWKVLYVILVDTIKAH